MRIKGRGGGASGVFGTSGTGRVDWGMGDVPSRMGVVLVEMDGTTLFAMRNGADGMLGTTLDRGVRRFFMPGLCNIVVVVKGLCVTLGAVMGGMRCMENERPIPGPIRGRVSLDGPPNTVSNLSLETSEGPRFF